MTLLISIFGGMFLTAVLYVVGRLGRLSNYWAAVIAAAIPSLAYLVYAVGHPVGLDTVTLHVIAYPTVAVLLGMLNGAKAKRAPAGHWAPKLLVGFFLVMLVIMAGFVYIAGQGLPPALAGMLLPDVNGKTIHTGFAGVVAHHQEAAKGIGQHLRMEDKLSKLGWQVEVAGLGALRAGEPAPVSVHILDTARQPVTAVAVGLELGRPGQTGTETLDLTGGAEGYHGTLAGLTAGTWVSKLRLARGEDTIVLEHTIEVR
jgi:hypothetical protein